jgi:hypothetical protein
VFKRLVLVVAFVVGLPLLAVDQPAGAYPVNLGSAYGFFSTNSQTNFQTWDQWNCPDDTWQDCMLESTANNPIIMVFWNAPNARTVRSVLQAAFSSSGGTSSVYEYWSTGGLPVHDYDSGRKNCTSPGYTCTNPTYDVHYRLYPLNWQCCTIDAYNSLWGFIAMATAHYDINENHGCQSASGYPESAETYLADDAAWNGHASGWQVAFGNAPNTGGFYIGNAYSGWADCSHYFDSNGWATGVYVP